MPEEPTNKEHFQEMYQGQPPWDIGRPQKAFIEVADQIDGSILDVGCGTGEIAMFFAQRGHVVYGIDFLQGPIDLAKEKAVQRGIHATFLVQDATALFDMPQQFDNVIDCGLFHVFSDEDRTKYVKALACVIKPDGKLWMQCFSDKEPGTDGPRRISRHEIRDAFGTGWEIESIEESRFEVVPDLKDVQFSPGGPFAWFAVVRRTA